MNRPKANSQACYWAINLKMPRSTKIYAEHVVNNSISNNDAASKLPEPPVVVYVKEIGKAGHLISTKTRITHCGGIRYES